MPDALLCGALGRANFGLVLPLLNRNNFMVLERMLSTVVKVVEVRQNYT